MIIIGGYYIISITTLNVKFSVAQGQLASKDNVATMAQSMLIGVALKVCSHMVLRVLLEGVLRMNSDEVLDWLQFAITTSSGKWKQTLRGKKYLASSSFEEWTWCGMENVVDSTRF